MSEFKSLPVVEVDYNVRPTLVEGVEVHRAHCKEFWALTSPLKPGNIVFASADEEGFVAKVLEAPVARGKRLDPFTGEATQAYRVLVTPIDITALTATK